MVILTMTATAVTVFLVLQVLLEVTKLLHMIMLVCADDIIAAF